ncbi:hypothetical protein [Halorarum salinum]|uniref:Uncharacterized protein n=1 Tax=Halorarum salinum TaxID=2743089 RepID=A0A7D5Q9B4_9EURY|nr:hypothetical protein [Halobaculum salinum]QLG60818.1 hypothetical protein HUG12_03275 [Halobaculum salinum]
MNALVAPAFGYLAVVAGAALAGRLLGLLVHRTEAPLRWYRRGIALLCPAAAVVAFGALAATGAFDLVAAALPAGTLGLVGFVSAFVLPPTLATFVPYLASARTYGDLRGHEVEPIDALRQLVRYLLSVLVPIGVMAWFALAVDGGALVVAWAALAAAAVVLAVCAPLLAVLGRRTRPPTDAERERMEAAIERADVPVRGVRVMPTDGGSAQARILGVGGLRHLFLTDAVLEEFDDEGTAALVGLAGSHRDYHLPSVGLLVYGAAASVASAVGGGPIPAFLVGYVVSNECVRRLSYRADAAAVGRSGLDPATVTAALERVAALHDRQDSPSAVARVLLSVPDFPRRLAAVRARTARGAPDGDGSR